MKLVNAFDQVLSVDQLLLLEILLINRNLPILKVLLAHDFLGPDVLIALPVLLALGEPLLHECLVLP